MEEKKEIKIRLSTVIYLLIIVTLVVTLGVTYYLGFVADNNVKVGGDKATNFAENVATENQTDKEIVQKEENFVTNNSTQDIKLNIGNFSLKDATDDEDMLLWVSILDNGFVVNAAGGMAEYSGTYKISNKNQLICNVEKVSYTDVSPDDKASFTLTFKIIDSNTLKLESISDKKLYNSKSIGMIYEKN